MNTNKWTDGLDQVTQDFQNTFSRLNSSQLNWKPNPAIWSIAQNISHIITVNASYPPVIESLQKGTYKVPFIGKIGFMVNFLGKMILKGVDPRRQKKMKTFPLWEPSQSDIPEGILDRFSQHQEKIKEMIATSSDLLDQGAVIASPASNKIAYKLETAFDIILDHEKRHFAQAKEVMELMSENA